MNLVELLNKPWAIVPESLREIHAIYQAHLKGEKQDIAAVEARLGRPLANEQQTYTVREGGVAVLPIEGVIAPKANLFTQISGGVSAQMLVKQVQSAGADTRVKALLQVIDSPGGSVFGIPEWGQAVRELSAVKPVVTVSDAQIASAAYWGGAQAGSVYLTGVTAQAGSIGVYARLGLSQADPGAIEFTRGKYKRGSINGEAPSPEYMAYWEGYLDYMYSVFVEAVADARGVSVDAVLEQMADGRLFTGQQALDAGLVDGFATVDSLVEQLATNPDSFKARRTAQVSMAATSAPAALPAAPTSSTDLTGDSMNMDKLKAEHPQLVKAIFDDAYAAGAKAERERIQSVEAALIPGHEKLIASLKFDGATSGGDAALKVNAAEREIREKQGGAERNDAPKPAAQAPAPTVPADAATKANAEAARVAALPLDERCKAEWDASAQLRSEFASFDHYVALKKAEAGGKVRVFAPKAAA